MSTPTDSEAEAGIATAVWGIVVTFNPDASVVGNVQQIARECRRVVVVDNGSESSALEPLRNGLPPTARILPLETNLGIAAALNRGVEAALGEGAQVVVTFDQDSAPERGFVAALLEMAEQVGKRWGVIGCRIAEVGLSRGYRWLRPGPLPLTFSRVPCGSTGLRNVAMVISSGSLLNLPLWQRVGGFAEGLFIDAVDTDYCLRVADAGGEVAVAAGAILKHRLGARRQVALPGPLGRPTFHSPLRHYFMARNRWLLLRRHWAKGYWVSFEFAAAVLNTFRVMLAEDRKRAKLRAIVIGTLDGIRGRKGACAPENFR